MIWVMFLILFFMGATVFSFINVLIYRVPRKMPFGMERSICPTCGNILKSYDLVPILSFMVLGGKCRNCKSKISWRYPLIELLGGILAILCFWNENLLFVDMKLFFVQGTLYFLFLAILTAIAFVDIDTMEIPNGFNIAIFVLGVVSIFVFPELTMLERVIGIFSVSVPMTLISLLVPGAFGGGDIKMMAAVGLFLGWKLCLLSWFLAILVGGAYGIYLLAAKKKGKKDHFAFGPFLCVGCMVALFWGEQILNWYFASFYSF
ncbi:MAG: prepilin peptidase [Anaerostipes sp.]